MVWIHWLPAVLFGIAIFLLSGQSNPPGAKLAPDYVLHFLEFGFFSLTVLWGVSSGLSKSVTWKTVLGSWALTTVYAVTDEFHQYFVPERIASFQDLVADSAGALTFSILAYFLLRWMDGRNSS